MAMKFFRASPLPTPPMEYSVEQLRQMVRVLELYFSQMDSQTPLSAEYFEGGGEYLTNPNGLFYSTTTQTLTSPDTTTPIAFENTYIGHDMVMNGASDSELTVDKAGIYNFQFTATLESTNSSSKTAYIWINRNGTAVGYSARPYTISGSGTKRTMSWNFNIDLQAGDYIELEWASGDTNLSLAAETASSPYPGVSSAVVAVTFVSNLNGVTVAAAP